MAAVEGARRMKRLGKYIMFSGVFAACAAWGIMALVDAPRFGSLSVFINVAPLFIFVGGALWASGWILEGFVLR